MGIIYPKFQISHTSLSDAVSILHYDIVFNRVFTHLAVLRLIRIVRISLGNIDSGWTGALGGWARDELDYARG